jgi:3-oxoacyl-[acyl-carrier protein] reductase
MINPTRTLIFGATGGIGSHIARYLAARGWPLVLAARDESKLIPLAEETNSAAIVIRNSSWSEYHELWEQATSLLGSIDGCVHAIGNVLLKPIHNTRESEFDHVLAVNLKTAAAVLAAATAARRRNQERNALSLVFFSSIAGGLGLPNHEAISAAKAGVEGMVRSAAASYARFGIRVNAIAPGLVDTPMTHRLRKQPCFA